MHSQKGQNDLVCFHGKPFLIIVTQLYAQTTNAEEAEVGTVLWRLTRLSRTNTQKRCPFQHRGLECKVGCQEIPGVTGKFGLGEQNEAGQRLTEFCQKNTLVIANILFQQHKRWLYTWTSPNGQYWNQIDTFFVTEDGEAIYSQQKQELELTVAQIISFSYKIQS